MVLVGGRAVKLEIARGRHHVGAALGKRLACILRFQRAELFRARRNGLAEAHQKTPALSCRQLAPGSIEGGAGGGHSAVNIHHAGARNACESASVRWAKHIK